MRQISRVEFSLLVLCFCLCIASGIQAQSQPATKTSQNSKASPKNSPPANDPPANKEPRVERRAVFHPAELPPELEEILRKWEIESAKIKTLHGKHTKTEVNVVFEVEKVTKGDFFFETPDKGRIDMIATPVKEGETSKKRTRKDGKPYPVEKGISERWICNGEAIIQINDVDRSYMKAEIPDSARGSNIVHTPLPFLFGMKAEEAKTRYQLTLFKNTEEVAIIVVVPLMEKDRQNYKKAAITLSKKSYLPIEVRMLSDEGIDVVYAFENVKVNDRKFLPEIFTKNPYNPNLRGYTLSIPPDDPADIQTVRGSAAPNDSKKPPSDKGAPPNPPKRTTQSTANGPKTSSSMNK